MAQFELLQESRESLETDSVKFVKRCYEKALENATATISFISVFSVDEYFKDDGINLKTLDD